MTDAITLASTAVPAHAPALSPRRIHFDVAQLPVRRVTVYSDRAQISRGISFDASANGEAVEVVIAGITQHADAASVQVDAKVPGVSILDVSTRAKYSSASPVDSTPTEDDVDNSADDAKTPESEKLSARITSLRESLAKIDSTRERLRLDMDLLDRYKSNFTHPGLGQSGHVLREGSIDAFWRFAREYGEMRRSMMREDLDLCREHADLQAEVEALVAQQLRDGQKKKCGNGIAAGRNMTLEVTVLMEHHLPDDTSKKVDGVAIGIDYMELTYVVSNASWSPRYDVRVDTTTATPKLHLHFQAEIRQATGEEWIDVPQLTLSTAKPALGGAVAEWPGPWKLRFKPAFVPQPNVMLMKRSKGVMMPQSQIAMAPPPPSAAPLLLAMGAPPAPRGYSRSAAVTSARAGAFTDDHLMVESQAIDADELASTEGGFGSGGGPGTVGGAVASQGVAGMSFLVQQARSSIPSDNIAHKVTIAVLQFEPKFRYITTPKHSANVFLKARVRNTSSYALMSGPANVFMDNSFVARSSISDTSPMEEFDCSLGVDSSVRVMYPAATRQKDTTGFIAHTANVRVRQDIKLRNGRGHPVTVQIRDQIPVSEDARLKVGLIGGVKHKMERKDGGPVEELNGWRDATVPGEPRVWMDKGWLEWVVRIESGKEERIGFGYEIGYPSGETLSGI